MGIELHSAEETYRIALAHPVIVLVGPTASGKSEVAQRLCEALDGEVVGADSMQLYKGMDIGTGKVMPAQRRVPHHGLDLVGPDEPYSVARHQAYARCCFQDIDARRRRIVLCGGTGFYVRAAIDDYDFPPGDLQENPVRTRYAKMAEAEGNLFVWELLKEKDPESARLIHHNNVRRTIRALELLEVGESYAVQVRRLGSLPQAVPAFFIGLRVEPTLLNAVIDDRVDMMIEQGLVDEVKKLLGDGFRESLTAPQAIGYKELVAALDGKISIEQAICEIKTATHRYAKKQRAWFRKDERIRWVDVDPHDIDDATSRVLATLGTMEHQETSKEHTRDFGIQ